MDFFYFSDVYSIVVRGLANYYMVSDFKSERLGDGYRHRMPDPNYFSNLHIVSLYLLVLKRSRDGRPHDIPRKKEICHYVFWSVPNISSKNSSLCVIANSNIFSTIFFRDVRCSYDMRSMAAWAVSDRFTPVIDYTVIY